MAWIALMQDVTQHPTVDGAEDRIVELHDDNSIHFPSGRVVQLTVLTDATEESAGLYLRDQEEASAKRELLASFDAAPETVFRGFSVRMRDDATTFRRAQED